MAIRIERIAWNGWQNCWRIANNDVELIVTGDIGPRILVYRFAGGRNIFKNFPDQMGSSGESVFVNRGGSRIWIAPEDRAATYAPDNFPVDVQQEGDTLIATAPVEPATLLEKQMLIRLAPTGTEVEITHRVANRGLLPVEFSIWILAVLDAGGAGITGFPPRGTHPECLAPANPLVMWAFTNLADPRWRFLERYLVLHQDPAHPTPQKIGHFHPHTWGAYLLGSDLFVKRYQAEAEGRYPDFGCSFEMFANGDVLELETLGPVKRVPPGQAIEHVERWSLHPDVHVREWTDAGLDEALTGLRLGE
ncbi:MAG: hypothetical protein JNL98_11915 [Bryobacterales bacterium]|nr:hypothetical protein [Bryobacterales bacterium]